MRFGDPGWRLGYARDAINSYFVFATLREKGVLARHLRFQVSLPSVNSVLPPRIFPNTADLDKIKPGFTDALAAEVDKIVKKIPAKRPRDPVGLRQRGRDVYGNIPQFPREGAIERNVAQFKRLSGAKSPPMSRSVTIFASARSAAGRVSARRTLAKP